ncbi:hypothetical protein WR25_24883 [Diploscapter pachys]|uniref:C2H2-type domain-containing protein n=1 Tax=Diploscapter pachys TaxID=2018661 RepID=A0A2A2LHQ7_9BILA|nr:hypothetical protein WR25_24883 [Diploscapter pachys]
MVEHLEYFPWLCRKDGCGAIKFSQQKLEEHQLAHHGEECEMKYVPNREKHSELRRYLEAVKHGLKVNQAQPEASMVNQILAAEPHFATPNLLSSTNSNYEQPVLQRSINIKESESDDDCVIVHVQPHNPNEPRKPRRSSAASAIENNHENASTERRSSGEHVIEKSTVSIVGSPRKSPPTIAPIRSSSPVHAPTPVAQAVVNRGFISAPNQSPSERYYLTSEREAIYIKCRMCGKKIGNFYNNKRPHVLTHLLREENLSIFSCTFPDCEMRSSRKHEISRHVLTQHNSSQETWVKRHDTSEFSDRIKAMGKLCFGDENENVTVSPSKITRNVGDRRNSETKIEAAVPKRRRCQPRNEDNISIDPNSTRPTWLFCHECNKDVRIYIYPPTGYMQNLLMHIEGHMALIYSKTWTLDEIRDVSFKCFKQRNLIEKHMPTAWILKNEKLMKDQNSTQMIDPNLPTTSRASMEQQDSEEMEDDRAPQVDMENDESDDSEEFYRI